MAIVTTISDQAIMVIMAKMTLMVILAKMTIMTIMAFTKKIFFFNSMGQKNLLSYDGKHPRHAQTDFFFGVKAETWCWPIVHLNPCPI